MYKAPMIQMMVDFALEATEPTREWENIFKVMKKPC